MITPSNIDDVVRGIVRTGRELKLDNIEIIWSQDLYEMLCLFVSINAFVVGHRKFRYMGITQIKGRKNMKGDFAVRYI